MNCTTGACRLFVNGRIRTMQADDPIVDAMAVRDGRILATGNEVDCRSALPADPQVIDLGGRTVTPGLIDAHTHLLMGARFGRYVDLSSAPTREKGLDALRKGNEVRAADPVLRGFMLNDHGWSTPLDCHSLDAIVGERKAVVLQMSLHGVVVSSSVLRAAGITKDTPDPKGGVIGRDASGTPNGVLTERASALVRNVVPHEASQDRDLVRDKIREANRLGITCVHDFETQEAWDAFSALRSAGELTCRVRIGWLTGRLYVLECTLEQLPDPASLEQDDLLRVFAVKCVADGALGSGTASMLHCCCGSRNLGVRALSPTDLDAVAREAWRRGWGVAVHAIGDAAVRDTLEAFRRWPATTRQLLRPRMEHAQLVDPAYFDLFGSLGVTASMQPYHAVDDRPKAEALWSVRDARGGYAWRQLANGGARLAFGSDYPVAPLDPRTGIQAAVLGGFKTTRTPRPERAITLDEAFDAYTATAAHSAFDERLLGRLSPGLQADAVIWALDPWSADPEALTEVPIESTWVAGERVYQR